MIFGKDMPKWNKELNKLQRLSRKELEEKIKKADELLSVCNLCPRKCKVRRLEGEKGYCKAGKNIEIASYHLHYGEEPPISGRFGSGTIFFSNCSLRCVFCQNYPLSQMGEGRKVSIEELSEIMLELQEKKAHNINFVTPTHYMPQILKALLMAKEKGLGIPLVYNCSGYESVATLELLDGIIDIYMPDFKYAGSEPAKKYSGAGDYAEVALKAIKEMFRQVGDLKVKDGIAEQGILIRHLVLPDDLAGSKKVFELIRDNISPKATVNIMAQYYPTHKACEFPELSRQISIKEYNKAVNDAKAAGLTGGFKQVMETLVRNKIPEWKDGLKDN